ncbi:SMI1/KNR4 family protein [Sporosarcina luteola]|uniref:SMI1/KNR4 family protein n=1 Tax=Sporosarcina luteola TaxID=582850 RepID=UPI0020413C41|nr:SMI1/KNR4 family protein [Sporosarcina luteola]MCM3711114.1 SMI1/KNR4 family protein [Sporosarcina luteola]
MWKDYLVSVSKECQFKAPATEADSALIKEKLNIDLPKKLADLYKETNGVFGNCGISFIWSTEQMVKENLFSRSMRPVDTLLFFSNAGNGDLFGYLIKNGSIPNDDIYVWNHEDDSQRVIASSLEEFIKGWILGEISV